MIIQPKQNYTNNNYPRLKLDKRKWYLAEIATNQPDYKQKGKVFCMVGGDSMLLEGGDYKVISKTNNMPMHKMGGLFK